MLISDERLKFKSIKICIKQTAEIRELGYFCVFGLTNEV